MIVKIKCKTCYSLITRNVPERQSKNKYYLNQLVYDMRGINTLKYCIKCKQDRKREESKLYQRKRIKNSPIKKHTQYMKIKERLLYHINNMLMSRTRIIDNVVFEYNLGIQHIYNCVSDELNVPRSTVRKVMHIEKINRFK